MASSLLLLISTRIDGRSISEISTLRPAASRMTPFGASMRPEFSTRGATSTTWPPAAVRMLPSVRISPAPGVSPNLKRPARKSWSLSFSDDTTRPATSTCEPLPNRIPLGLIKNTRPFDCSCPRMRDGSLPVTRLSTALAAFCCTKRVSSPRLMPKLCQLMMVPGVLVTVSVAPLVTKLAWPFTTFGACGLAVAPQAAIANSQPAARRNGGPCRVCVCLCSVAVFMAWSDALWSLFSPC